tara:strand:+ start:887 stop:1204 length:318 start_codon:yes stop_codon:yes gene_type:complete
MLSCSTIDDNITQKNQIIREEYFVKFDIRSGNGIITDRHSCLGRSELRGCKLKSKRYHKKSFIEVWAFPSEGYRFIGWSGSYDTNKNPLLVFVDSEKEIIAEFSK